MSLGITPGVPMSKLKSRILNPAQTSVYSVLMNQPSFGMQQDRELFELTCIEAALPGSSLATVETSRDYMGVVERHAYARLYDETIDLTFLVTLDSNYLQIRFFDYWMKWIVGEDLYNDQQMQGKIHQRARYPSEYQTNFKIVKYEKSLGSGKEIVNPVLVYNFVDAFPKSMNTIQVSYDTSQLLKTTVSMTYTRYFIGQEKSTTDFAAAAANLGGFNVDYDLGIDLKSQFLGKPSPFDATSIFNMTNDSASFNNLGFSELLSNQVPFDFNFNY